MKKTSNLLKFTFFLIQILLVGQLFAVVYAEEDTTPPELNIYDTNIVTPNSEIIVHGLCIDESGIQKVIVNGEEATGWFYDIYFSFQRTVQLTEGPNTIVVTAYDNSANHNEVSETFTITYQSSSYQGPTIRVVPVSTQPSNNATVQCYVNPNGVSTSVYLWSSYSTWENAPFSWGNGGFAAISGTEEVLFNYTYPQSRNLAVGESVSYIFRVRNSLGTAFTDVETFEVIDPIPMPDTEPPEIAVWEDMGNYDTPDSEVIIAGHAWDASGVKNVTLNESLVTGFSHAEYFSWQKKVNLVEGQNIIKIKAYEDSPNELMSEKSFTITYQPIDYVGPTIELLSPVDITANSATLRCKINPNGSSYTMCYLWFGEESRENSPFHHGNSLGDYYSGTEDIEINYHLESSNPEVTIAFLFFVHNPQGRDYTEVGTVTLRNPANPSIETISITPEVPNYDDEVMVEAVVTDDTDVDFGLLEYSYNSFETNTTMTQNGDVFSANIPVLPYDTQVSYKVYAKDVEGNWAVSETYEYTVADNVAPTINSVECTNLLDIEVNASEPIGASGVNSVTLLLTVDGQEWLTRLNYSSDTGLWSASILGYNQLAGKTIEYRVYASDNAWNSIMSETFTHEVEQWRLGDLNRDDNVNKDDIKSITEFLRRNSFQIISIVGLSGFLILSYKKRELKQK